MALTVIVIPLPKPQSIPDDPETGVGSSDSPNCDGDYDEFDY